MKQILSWCLVLVTSNSVLYALAQNVTLVFFSYLFWTEWGTLPRLSRCSLDGKHETRRTLIDQEIVWPNALTIDYSSNTLWWADAKLKKIESCDLNGSNRRFVVGVNAGHPFSIAVNSKYVFWTNWKTNTLDKIEKDSVLKYPTRTSSFKSHPLGVVTIYSGKQKAGISYVTRSVVPKLLLPVTPFAMHRNIHRNRISAGLFLVKSKGRPQNQKRVEMRYLFYQS